MIQATPEKAPPKRVSAFADFSSDAIAYKDLTLPEFIRTQTGLGELDRVLGGGLVNSSVVLLSGEPGIGKSTLLLQISDSLGKSRKVLYVSGEESYGQLKLRAGRLGIAGHNLFILTETNIENIMAQVDKIAPEVIIVDSIQTIFTENVSSAPGSINQVKECALAFIEKAKSKAKFAKKEPKKKKGEGICRKYGAGKTALKRRQERQKRASRAAFGCNAKRRGIRIWSVRAKTA